jgi:NADH:ubiquinone oxidoreductase subunit 6 (subunit J)
MFFQIVQLVGAIFILYAFALQQLGRLAAETRTYQILNLIGGMFLCAAAVAARQYGFILLEGCWSIASTYGVLRVLRTQ